MIDTHAHLGDDAFDSDRDEVIKRAQNAGVCACIIVSELPSETAKIKDICRKYPRWAYPGLGLFPSSFTQDDLDMFDAIADDDWICFGEIGLDTWLVQDDADRRRHEDVFRHILRRARTRDLPVNVHSRNCGKRCIEILCEERMTRVHLHAFDAKPSTVRLGIEAGFFFSIPASIVHSPQKEKLAKIVPVSQMLLETDAPVLGPDRTARNEPANIALALNKVAEIKNIPLDALDAQLDCNARSFYRLN